MVSMTEPMTVTMKQHAANAEQAIAQPALFFGESPTIKVARNVAEKPPRNALTKAICCAISAR